MKNKIKNTVLGFLSVIGISLVLFAIYGLLTYEWGFSHPVSSDETSLFNQSNTVSAETDTDKEDADVIYKEGDIPEIDQVINEQIDYICNETNFMWETRQDGNILYSGGYSGEHDTNYTNKTGIDFPYFHFWIMLYNLKDISNYSENVIPDEQPIENHDLFNGSLNNMQTIPINFTSETGEYNVWYWTFEYKLPPDYNNPSSE